MMTAGQLWTNVSDDESIANSYQIYIRCIVHADGVTAFTISSDAIVFAWGTHLRRRHSLSSTETVLTSTFRLSTSQPRSKFSSEKSRLLQYKRPLWPEVMPQSSRSIDLRFHWFDRLEMFASRAYLLFKVALRIFQTTHPGCICTLSLSGCCDCIICHAPFIQVVCEHSIALLGLMTKIFRVRCFNLTMRLVAIRFEFELKIWNNRRMWVLLLTLFQMKTAATTYSWRRHHCFYTKI